MYNGKSFLLLFLSPIAPAAPLLDGRMALSPYILKILRLCPALWMTLEYCFFIVYSSRCGRVNLVLVPSGVHLAITAAQKQPLWPRLAPTDRPPPSAHAIYTCPERRQASPSFLCQLIAVCIGYFSACSVWEVVCKLCQLVSLCLLGERVWLCLLGEKM